ncbi:Solute carrier family 22 member 3 [Tupaia chinensis]|uniref:Solute carrier family 22 member 3 n=1 Tax=Tupaia chinensis TaxID=246437 RepID=L9KKH5_TUPCH|nr:Solute carrier family 22 member 3 [Tupaia chinensis]
MQSEVLFLQSAGGPALLGGLHKASTMSCVPFANVWPGSGESTGQLLQPPAMAAPFDLVCVNAWMLDLTQAILNLGFLAGAFTLGYAADRYGRIVIYLISCFGVGITGVVVAFAPNFPVFVIFRFLQGVFGKGTWMTSYVIAESTRPQLDSITRSLPTRSSRASGSSRVTVTDEEVSNPSFLDLVRTPQMRKCTLILMFAWFTSAVVYQGLVMRLGIVGGNLYIDFFISGVVELPGALLILLTIERVGRRLPFAASNIVAGVACLVTAFLPEASELASERLFLFLSAAPEVFSWAMAPAENADECFGEIASKIVAQKTI